MGKHRTDPNMKAIRIGHPPYLNDSTETSRFEPLEPPEDPEATSLLAPNEQPTDPIHSTELIQSSSDEPEAAKFWADDPQFDDDRPRRALWAVVLCVTLAIVIVGGIGWMFGASKADGSTPTPVVTITETETVTSTPKPKANAATVPAAKTITKVGPTIYRTRPPTVVRVTSPPKVITVTKTPRPLPRVTQTIEIEIPVPGPTVTEFEPFDGSQID